MVDKTDPQRSPPFEDVQDKVLAAYKDRIRHKLALQKATELMNETHDLFLVANVLGHAKLNSTKVYLHKDKNYIEYMRNRMNRVKEEKKDEMFMMEKKGDTD